MIDGNAYLVFVLVTVAACVSPGPAAVAVVAQSALGGLGVALWTVVGIAAANAAYFGLSASGVGAMLIAFPAAFGTLQFVGALYILYLGVEMLRGKAFRLDASLAGHRVARGWRSFARGAGIELANPKAILYFVTLLPQFLDAGKALAPQLLALAVTTVLIDMAAYSSYAALGRGLARLGSPERATKAVQLAGGGMLLLGAVAILARR